MALAGAGAAGDHEVVVAAHEVEACELEQEGLVERGLEVPLECLERLALDEPARVDAPDDALLELVSSLEAEDMLDERGGTGALVAGPGEELVELVERAGRAEEFEVSSQPGDDGPRSLRPRSRCFGLAGSLRLAMLGALRCVTDAAFGSRDHATVERILAARAMPRTLDEYVAEDTARTARRNVRSRAYGAA